jgi:hypothetical protein
LPDMAVDYVRFAHNCQATQNRLWRASRAQDAP